MSPSISPNFRSFATPESEQDELEALRTSHRKLESGDRRTHGELYSNDIYRLSAVISVLRQEWQHTTQELEEVRRVRSMQMAEPYLLTLTDTSLSRA